MAPAPYKMEREQDKLVADGKPVLDQDGEPVKEVVEIKVNAFNPVSTFDISQTDREPVPRLGVDELTGSVEGYAEKGGQKISKVSANNHTQKQMGDPAYQKSRGRNLTKYN